MASRSFLLGPTPDLDHDRGARLRDALGLAQRRDQVGGEEERVEAGDEVERVVVVGESLHLTHPQVSLGHAFAGDLDQRLRGVEPERLGPAVGDEAEEHAGAAADVENPLPGRDPDAPDRLLVGGHLELLVRGPVPRPGAPQGPPLRGAAGFLLELGHAVLRRV
jgi:hypothetical protein